MPEIQMPKLSDTMTEGTVVAWKKKKGDKVSTGDVIAEIETDKATMEWESPEDGTLTEIYVEEGGKVEVGEKIAFIGSEGEGAAAKKEEKKPEAPKDENQAPPKKKEQAETEKPAPAEEEEPETAPPQEDEKSAEKKAAPPPKPEPKPREESRGEARVKASPLARRLAAEQGVDLSTIKGTGPDGRVTENDVRGAGKLKGPATHPAAAPRIPAGEGSRTSLTGMRKIIAERLVASKGPVPHFYLNIEIDAGPLMSARAELKSAGEKSDSSRITVNDFVLKASVQAAVKVPKANASFDGDAIVQYNDVNLAIAVAIEDGLVTPVIRAAQSKSLREISEAVKDLAGRARNKRMKPEEFQGGTFTVSNLGSYGIDNFSAIINPPQGFVLSIGAIVKKAVIDDCDQIAAGQRMSIGMSCDHRVIDGALGAEYLKELRHLLENPTLLLI
ncbi:MAG TPA: pyruvate dehydrogenase complex dihydrolipoamide acetyltransferase [Chthoniobacterales bacterium]|nr:pyruvate dehydrogenase complex dihydrolipoamide acetyltransferase [Chthoniobacterales bacterium]